MIGAALAKSQNWYDGEVYSGTSIMDTIGESQFVRYREVSLVERFDILMTITIIVIHIHSSNHNGSLFS